MLFGTCGFLEKLIWCYIPTREGRSSMPAEDKSSRYHQEDITEEYSFDTLAIELADGTFTRARALKLMGVALMGSLGAFTGISAVANPAGAKRRKKKRKKKPVMVGLTPSPPPPPPGPPPPPTGPLCSFGGTCADCICNGCCDIGGLCQPGTS